MKVLHVEAGRHLYGGARQAGLLIDGLAAAGVANVLVCPPDQPLARRVSGAQVVPLAMGGDLDFGLATRLESLIRQERPDVVHVHSRRGADLVGGRAAAGAGVPAVLTRRVESREPARWLRHKCRHYGAVVAISTAVRAELEHARVSGSRVALIPSAVDTSRIRPDPEARPRLLNRFGLADDALVLGMAAQFVPRKAHTLLLACLPALRSRHPNLHVLLFGRGPLEPRIRRRVMRRQLDSLVTFCGFDDDLPQVLPGLDVFAHPAAREGLGSAVLEAMSAGCAVAAAPTGGLLDVIVDRESGLLVPARTPAAWTGALHRLLRDPALRGRLGRNGRARVEAGFSVTRMTTAYLSLYHKLADRRHAA